MAKFSRDAFLAKQLEAANKQKTHHVKLPSGVTFELRYPPLEQWIANGMLPQSLLRISLETTRGRGILSEAKQGELQAAVSVEDQVQSIKFRKDAVQYACVSPKLVENPVNDDEIAPWELSFEDFNFIFAWTMDQSDAATSKVGK